MPKFNDAAAVDQIAYEMRLADWPRSVDRTRVNELFNGVPPHTQQEVQENRISVNVNYLEGTRLSHDARMQFASNFLKPGKFFTAVTDMGAPHKRSQRSEVVTMEAARVMKRSPVYFESFRSKFAMLTLHGIGPNGWDTSDFWCPDSYGIEDVLVPANTLLTMKNLPLFILYHSYTGPELIRLTRDRESAKKAGWNLGLVDKCLEYIDKETMALTHNNWPEVWSPEKMQERVKGDGGFYAADSVPTIDCFDFYFWDDDDDSQGWKRRVILDSWSTPEGSGGSYTMQRNNKTDFGRDQFLFTSRNRKVASSWREIVSFQFADLSAVAPFHYHTVRGMGYLLYAVCHLQNRMRCKFNEAVFEALMMYFRVRSMDEAQRALKVEMVNLGFIDETLQFIPANERFQVNAQLVELGLKENQSLITANVASWTQPTDRSQDRTEKTKFQVMAELQAMTSMLSSAMGQAYRYQEFENSEIFRRLCLKNSRDPDSIAFRARCMRKGVPENMLVPEAWELHPERVMGAGNKTLEMAMAEQLMQFRNLYDPEPQRKILRDVTFAITEDPGKTEELVPLQPTRITDSVTLAQTGMATLMMGLPLDIKTGINHIEYVDSMMKSLAMEIMKLQKRGGMATQDQIEGMMAVFQHLSQHIGIVAQDPEEKQRVKEWGDQLKKMGNLVKAMAQRLAEQQQQAAQQGGNGQDAETAAKIKATLITAQAKADNTRESHAQRTAQRKLQWEQEMMQRDQEHQQKLKMQSREHGTQLRGQQRQSALELVTDRAKAAQDLDAEKQKQRLKSTEE